MDLSFKFQFTGPKKGFVFFNYSLVTKDELNIDLGDGYILRKADNIEKQTIQYFLSKHIGNDNGYHIIQHLEEEKTALSNGQSFRYKNDNEIEYYVLECPFSKLKSPLGSIINFDPRIKLIFRLFHRHLYELLVINYVNNEENTEIIPNLFLPSDSMQVQRILNSAEVLHYSNIPKEIILHKSDIEKLCLMKEKIFLIASLGLNQKEYKFLEHNFDVYLSLNEVSINSRYRLIVLFSVLEGLLIDENSETGGKAIFLKTLLDDLSIKHPDLSLVSRKIGLKGPDTNTIGTWIKLIYKYRNSLAHGFQSDWKKELASLEKQFVLILPFLEDIIREIWVIILNDPIEFNRWRVEKNKPSSP